MKKIVLAAVIQTFRLRYSKEYILYLFSTDQNGTEQLLF